MTAIDWYQDNYKNLIEKYESLKFEDVHKNLLPRLPEKPASILDIGAGTGRDSAWLANYGYQVVAVEPSLEMRKTGINLHSDSRIEWVDDSLPELQYVYKSGNKFDLILLSAVWMHIPQNQRQSAFTRIIQLLKPLGLISVSLRHGYAEPERFIYSVSLQELENFCNINSAFIEYSDYSFDKLGRNDVYWTQVHIRRSY